MCELSFLFDFVTLFFSLVGIWRRCELGFSHSIWKKIEFLTNHTMCGSFLYFSGDVKQFNNRNDVENDVLSLLFRSLTKITLLLCCCCSSWSFVVICSREKFIGQRRIDQRISRRKKKSNKNFIFVFIFPQNLRENFSRIFESSDICAVFFFGNSNHWKSRCVVRQFSSSPLSVIYCWQSLLG